MPELLFELGCEELPASSVQRAFEQLKAEVCQRLTEESVNFGDAVALGTPRRLIVAVHNVEDRQPDMVKESRGPAVKAAYDESGAPTKALEGFCRGQGVEVSDVENRGEHVWVSKQVPGRPTIELLTGILPAAVLALTFDKTMRWASGTTRFARPIRWILASFGGDAVQLEIEGVRAGQTSRGHRFEAPDAFEALTFESLMAGLRSRLVEPDPDIRIIRIRDGALACSNGMATLTDDLVTENAYLCEWPSALEGSFPETYLRLPQAVLTTVMAKHERFFPVHEQGGRITNRFVSIRNGGQESAVREGNAWVLNARLNDASFFFNEDSKHTLAEFLEKAASMQFQEKLGSVRARADRLSKLAREVATWSGANDSESSFAEQAGLYAKADLSSGLVSELDELQGVIGGDYARRDGLPEPVCWAIASHYDLSKNKLPDCEGSRTAVRLLIADQLDKVAGFLGLGFSPSGSSDPYGLRRAATLLIEAAWAWPTVLGSFEHLFAFALGLYADQGVTLDDAKANATVQDIFQSRYEALLNAGHRYDLVTAACLEDDLLAPRAVRCRLECLKVLAGDTHFVQTATRPTNIVSASRSKGVDFVHSEVSAALLQSEEGEQLWSTVQSQAPLAQKCSQAEDVTGLIAALRPLVGPINAFFDSTMVMVDDTTVRNARLKLLSECEGVLRLAGDFTKVVIEG